VSVGLSLSSLKKPLLSQPSGGFCVPAGSRWRAAIHWAAGSDGDGAPCACYGTPQF